MHHIYETEGIIIGGMDVGDSSRRVYLFSREMGVVLGKVQNGRSLSSKLRPSVQDFCLGRYSLVRGKSEWKVVGAKSSENIFENIKKDGIKVQISANVLNLIKKLVEEGAETHELFDTVKEFMIHLPNIKSEELKSAECLILLRILNKLGFLRADPDLVVCLEEGGITERAIQTVFTHRLKTVKMINESLHAAEIKR